MKRLTVFSVIFSMGTLFAMVTGSLTLGRLFAAEPTSAPQMICYLNDDRYVLDLQVIPSPTRIVLPSPTVTPLPEPSRTPAPTLTPTVALCTSYRVTGSPLRVRASASLSGTILRTLATGTIVMLSNRVADTVVADGVTWRKLCADTAYLSAAYVEMVK